MNFLDWIKFAFFMWLFLLLPVTLCFAASKCLFPDSSGDDKGRRK